MRKNLWIVIFGENREKQIISSGSPLTTNQLALTCSDFVKEGL